MKAFVFAGHYQQYRQWLREKEYNEKDYPYVSAYERMLGIDHNIPYILVGTYYESPVYDKCRDRLMGYKERKK